MKWYAFFFVSAALVGIIQSILIKSGVSDDDKKLIVDRHNQLRQMLLNGTLPAQPKALNMTNLKWDDDLAKVAQAWADNMEWRHNPNRSDPLKRFPIGENIFIFQTNESDNNDFKWKIAMDKWADEYKFYSYCPIRNCPTKNETGHYTQMIWAKTEYVGCGASYFDTIEGWFSKFYVCNYGQAGNWFGEHPYEIDSVKGP